MDPVLPGSRQSHILAEAEAKVVVTQSELESLLPDNAQKLVRIDADWRLIARHSNRNGARRANARNLAYVIYTSGTTGTPKGVMIEHRSVVNLAHALRTAICGLQEQALTTTVNAPLWFDSSIKQLAQVTYGHTLLMMEGDVRVDAHKMKRFFSDQPMDVLDCTPSHLRMMLDVGLGAGERKPKIALVGGEEIKEDLWRTLADLEGVQFYNVYGPTECAVDALASEVRGVEARLGRPLSNVRVYILDEHINALPIGAVGEICIGGVGVGRGYLKQPAMTAERFIPDPRGEGSRLYRTGDLGKLDEAGNISYVGRRDSQVKAQGYRIELAEIEKALSEHDCVKEAVVIAREDEQGVKRLVAYLTASRKEGLTMKELRSHLVNRLPNYMLPSAFVALDSLPLNASGKLDKRALPLPGASLAETEQGQIVPSGPVQEALADVWLDVLRVERVGANDNFFYLGGHSMLAAQVISRIINIFGVEIPLRSLFERPTIAEFSEVIEDALIEQIEALNDEEVRTLIGDQPGVNTKERNVEATRI